MLGTDAIILHPNVPDTVDLSHNLSPSHLSTSVLFHPRPMTAQVSLLHHPQSGPTTANAEAQDIGDAQHQSRSTNRVFSHPTSPICYPHRAVIHTYPASNDREGPFFIHTASIMRFLIFCARHFQPSEQFSHKY